MDRGSVYRRCGCRDKATGRLLGARCPGLRSREHGSWYFSADLPSAAGERHRARRGGFATQDAAAAALEALASPTAGPQPGLSTGEWLSRRGHTSPDWPGTARPAGCRLDAAGYLAFLSDRATGTAIEITDGVVTARASAGSVLTVWSGSTYQVTPVKRGSAAARWPSPDSSDPAADQSGAAVFTWRGDYRATGWLAAYSRVQDQSKRTERGVSDSSG